MQWLLPSHPPVAGGNGAWLGDGLHRYVGPIMAGHREMVFDGRELIVNFSAFLASFAVKLTFPQ